MKKLSNFILFFFLLFSSIGILHSQKPILLKNFNLIDGSGNPLQKGKSLLIVADTIHSILNHGDKIPLENFEEIDLSGKYLLPGLFDSHTHIASTSKNKLDTAKRQLEIMAKHGITGIRDMAGDARLLAYLARQALLDEIISPNIYYSALMAGPRFFSRDRRVVNGSKGIKVGDAPWMQSITNETDIKIAVAKAKGTGATGIKLYASLPQNLIEKITKEAHEQNLLVWAHAAILPVLPSTLVNSHVNSLSHSALLAAEQLFNKPVNGARPVIDTVLSSNAPKLKQLSIKMSEYNVYLDPTVIAFRDFPSAIYNNGLLATQIAFNNGVSLIIGTDKSSNIENPDDLPLIDEMNTLVNEAHIPALEVIKAATKNSADFLKIGDKVGTIEVGKKANILIVNDNPLDDIRNLLNVFKVFKNGILL